MTSVPGTILAPGDRVQQTGVYRVYHRLHRLPHNVLMKAGETTPRCRKCQDEVRFELVQVAEPLVRDADFLTALAAASAGLVALLSVVSPWFP